MTDSRSPGCSSRRRARPSMSWSRTTTAVAIAEEHEPVRPARHAPVHGRHAILRKRDRHRSGIQRRPSRGGHRPGSAGRAGTVGERVREHARPGARRRRRAGRRPRASIRSSSSRSASRRRSWMARASSRASPSARRSGVSSVSRTMTRPSSSATAVPGRGVAWISTSSARKRHPRERDAAVVVDRRRHPSRAAAMTAGIAEPSRLPTFGQERP